MTPFRVIWGGTRLDHTLQMTPFGRYLPSKDGFGGANPVMARY